MTNPEKSFNELSNHAGLRFASLSGHVFIQLDRDGQTRHISQNFPEDLLAHLQRPSYEGRFQDLIDDDPLLPWGARLENALNDKVPQEFSLQLKGTDGQPRSFHCKLQYDADDEVFFVVLRRLSKSENELPNKLQRALTHLNLSLKTAKLGLWEVELKPDLKGIETISWDAEMCHMHGVPGGVSVDRAEWFMKHIHPSDFETVREKFGYFLRGEETGTLDVRYRIVWPNGELHFIEMHGSMSPNDTAPYRTRMYGVAKDITTDVMERKFLEDQKNRILANSRMTVLGEISGGIAHEINNPLTVIQARSFQLIQMVEQNNLEAGKIRAIAESISKTGDKIAKIIKSIRGFAQSQENTPFDTVSVEELIEETLDFCKVRFYNHGVEVKVAPIPEDLEIECRLIQIEEVLLNIFNNAHDAVIKLPQKWIEVCAFDKDPWVEIHVTDSGSGIPEDVAGQMMLPFYTTKDSGKGTGLGLSISSEIVLSHHGEIALDRTSKNTRFVLRFPKRQPTPEAQT